VPLLFSHALKYVVRKVQENQVGQVLNGTHPLLAYADDVNLLGENIKTIKKNAETLIGASKEVCLKINAKKLKYILLSYYQTARKNHDIKIANKSSENMAQFIYLGMTGTNQNFIQKESMRLFNLGNYCYH
jgi:hypothetical protein